MITLPSDPRFDPWRTCGTDIPAATAQALTTPLDPGTTDIVEKHTFTNGTILRGHTFFFPKSLYAVYGTGTWGPSGSPRYSWGGSWLTVAPNSRAILMDCTFRCGDDTTPAHHQEKGYNVFAGIPADSQLILINPTFVNADSALVMGGQHSHAVNVILQSTRPKNNEGRFGHYGVRVTGEWNALEGCDVQTRFHHDLSTQGTRHAVYKDVQGVDLVNDFHAWSGDDTDDDNLYCNLNHGLGTQPFGAGGASSNLPWDGDNATFYRLRKGDGTPITNFPAWLHAVVIPSFENPPEVPMLAIGDTVKTTALVTIRNGPSKASLKVGERPAGSHGTLAEGPVFDSASGFTYWQVTEFGGWCGQDRLVEVASAPPPPPPVPDMRAQVKSKLMSGEGMTDEEAEWLLL